MTLKNNHQSDGRQSKVKVKDETIAVILKILVDQLFINVIRTNDSKWLTYSYDIVKIVQLAPP